MVVQQPRLCVMAVRSRQWGGRVCRVPPACQARLWRLPPRQDPLLLLLLWGVVMGLGQTGARQGLGRGGWLLSLLVQDRHGRPGAPIVAPGLAGQHGKRGA